MAMGRFRLVLVLEGKGLSVVFGFCRHGESFLTHPSAILVDLSASVSL